jgi:hypothetical protein
MPDSNRPSGPGKPTQQQRDAAIEQEEIDELAEDRFGDRPGDPSAAARRAERDAHADPRSRRPTDGRSGGDNPDRS